SLTEEQKELRRLARDFAAKEICPLAHECDEAMRHPAEVIEKAHELGLMNLHVPEEYGGPGLSAFDGMLVGEELYLGCSGIGTSITANGLGAGPVIGFGSDEQRSEEHTSELQSLRHLVCRLLLEKKKKTATTPSSRERASRRVGQTGLRYPLTTLECR